MILPERALGEVLQPATATTSVKPEGEYPIAGIYSFGRGLIRRPTIRGSETSYAALSRLHVGQLTMSKLNAWEGALAVVPEEFDGSYVSPEYPVFEINRDQADPGYIAHLTTWPGLWERLTPRGSMVRRKRTNPGTLLTTKAPLPSLNEQFRITARLDAIFRKLDAIASARVQSAGLQAALTDRLLSDSGTETPLSEFLVPCDDFIDVIPSATYNTAGILSHGRGLFARPIIQGSETSYHRYNKIHAEQFIYSKLFGWEGALAVATPEFDGYYMSHEFPSFTIVKSRADVSYVGHLARWSRLHESLRDKGTGMGSRRQRINSGRLLSTTIPLPDLATQRRIVGVLDKVTRSTQAAETQDCVTQDFRSTVLNAAFNGRL
jgi:type I restriction enzyme, S subunit